MVFDKTLFALNIDAKIKSCIENYPIAFNFGIIALFKKNICIGNFLFKVKWFSDILNFTIKLNVGYY